MKKFLPVLFGALNLGIIGYFWWHSSGMLFQFGSANILIAFGRLSGLLLVFCVFLQFLFIGRVAWLERLFGMDKLSRIHKWLGYSLSAFLVAHPLLLVLGNAANSQVSWLSQFIDFVLHYEDVLSAFIAAVLFLSIIVISITMVRRRWRYETWYLTHLFIYLAVILAFGHQLSIGSDFLASPVFTYYWYALYAFVFGNFIWFRMGRPLSYYLRHRFTVRRVVRESGDAISLYIGGKGMDRLAIKPGQFVIVRLLTRQFWWQSHPFSVSQVFDGSHIRLTIKDKGDFTKAIQLLRPGARVVVDGPLGSMTPQRSRHNKVLLIAGGVGITPIRALAEDFAKKGKDVALLYGSRFAGDIIFQSELEELAKNYRMKIYFVLSRDTAWKGPRGHIDSAKISSLVPDFMEREVFLCGPKEMMAGARSSLQSLGYSRKVHFESFSFA